MNFGTMILVLLLLSGAGAAGGCSDSPASATGIPGTPGNLQALSVDDTTVQLQWVAPDGGGATGYSITWRGELQIGQWE